VADDAEVRAATVDDAAAIADVHVAAWRAAYRGIVSDEAIAARDERTRTHQWRGNLVNPGTLVAMRYGVVVGFASAGAAHREGEEEHGELYALYVHPDEWGGGVADALIEAAEAELRSAGFGEAVLWVFAQNPRARRFYERNGWHDDGGRDVFDGDGSNAPIARHRKRLAE
jgi:GNAT superfamily N-acetyltransferase